MQAARRRACDRAPKSWGIACARGFTRRTGVSGSSAKARTSCARRQPPASSCPRLSIALQRLQGAWRLPASTGVTSCEIAENCPASERAVLLEMDPSQRAPIHVEPVDGITGVMFIGS